MLIFSPDHLIGKLGSTLLGMLNKELIVQSKILKVCLILFLYGSNSKIFGLVIFFNVGNHFWYHITNDLREYKEPCLVWLSGLSASL